ncbi:hypothetical protein HC928_26295, partial [bacterium]|nr:hypothetical protein [bacterium]
FCPCFRCRTKRAAKSSDRARPLTCAYPSAPLAAAPWPRHRAASRPTPTSGMIPPPRAAPRRLTWRRASTVLPSATLLASRPRTACGVSGSTALGTGLESLLQVYPSPASQGWFLAAQSPAPLRAQVLLTYGNATQPGSPHVGDQLEVFARKELRDAWLTREAILANLDRSETLTMTTDR